MVHKTFHHTGPELLTVLTPAFINFWRHTVKMPIYFRPGRADYSQQVIRQIFAL